jgi:hypothetical protein
VDVATGGSNITSASHATDEEAAPEERSNTMVPSIIIAEDKAEDEASGDDTPGLSPPHEDNFSLHGHATGAQVDLAAKLLSSLTLPPGASSSDVHLKRATDEALGVAQGMLADLVDMARERDDWWRAKLRAEWERQNVWEESLKAVVREGEMLESELRTRSRRRTSRIVDSTGSALVSPDATLRHRPVNLPILGVPEDGEVPQQDAVDGLPPTFGSPIASPVLAPVGGLNSPPPIARSPSGGMTPTTSRRFSLAMASPGMEDGDTDEEDEFFDAIDANALPNLVVSENIASGGVHELSSAVEDRRAEYAGYEHPRNRLAITSDDRPPMSLWAVLKNSIGKDLTKISFPVFFNEPTSMLQRMAEDMEFSECLDAAAAEADPLRRIAYVAAFAMSNYSSTIGRIAKPFNPMLVSCHPSHPTHHLATTYTLPF